MFDVFFKKASELNREGRPFALAVVVRREAPVSGQSGDKAIIEADGSVHGWIGGGCTQPVIVREAQKAIGDGKVRLVRITPTASAAPQPGVIEYAMECHSGGALDIYIEPIMPNPQLIILGRSAVAQTLARLGKVLNYRVVAAAPGAGKKHFPEADEVLPEIDLSRLSLTPQSYVVASTQGEGDLQALEEMAKFDFPYAGLVASRKKAAQLFQELEEAGVSAKSLQRIKVPAGLDIQARTPEEIAVSILAEIIAVMRAAARGEEHSKEPSPKDFQEVVKIRNMTCQGCVATVESILKGIEGVAVHAVQIGSATISYDPSAVRRSQILEELEGAGYEALL